MSHWQSWTALAAAFQNSYASKFASSTMRQGVRTTRVRIAHLSSIHAAVRYSGSEPVKSVHTQYALRRHVSGFDCYLVRDEFVA
jgi:hypothetical protein